MELENQSPNDIDVDKLLGEIYGSEEVPGQGGVSAPTPSAPSPAPTPREWELDIRGQKVKADEQNLLKWAQQGYDYSQNQNTLKTERDNWLKEKGEWESRISPYQKIDEYARSNPEWWNHVNENFNKREQPQIPEEFKAYFEPIIKDYSEVKSFINNVQKEKEEARIKGEDQALDAEIKDIRSHYSDLDFDVKDQNGQSLEQKVIDHGIRNGIRTFKSAFRDYYHDELVKRAESKGIETANADAKKRQKLGLPSDSAPSGFDAPRSVSGMKWSDRSLSGSEILKEFNLGG